MIDYSMPKENNEDQDEEAESAISEAGKDIKKGEDRYNARMKLAAEGKAPPTVTLLALRISLPSANKSPKC